jgi:hypothetical protein
MFGMISPGCIRCACESAADRARGYFASCAAQHSLRVRAPARHNLRDDSIGGRAAMAPAGVERDHAWHGS